VYIHVLRISIVVFAEAIAKQFIRLYRALVYVAVRLAYCSTSAERTGNRDDFRNVRLARTVNVRGRMYNGDFVSTGSTATTTSRVSSDYGQVVVDPSNQYTNRNRDFQRSTSSSATMTVGDVPSRDN